MVVTERTCEGLPVHGDIVARYVVIQLTASGRHWDVKAQRFLLEHCYDAMAGLDLTRPTRIVNVTRLPDMQVIRAWN